ncbi:MerR family transcriptional regulator [Paenibacillus baekrokdamisoli]|uniref:MerR family transcriptional regulator n=1 Tax=Paenibacillus baekrokdamisoli TaxID=1712516 RepID=UPI000F76DB53|nr:MerR family transcriptional regulator [Paenibacillus baekrokdamisoli]
MQIKEVATKLNISPRAIRFYEEKGLISPIKQAHNQYRTFTEQDIWRLQTILSLREAGMPLESIKHALAEMDEDNIQELRYYLELQRSVLVAKWLEMKQVIETTDHMITLLKVNRTLPLEAIYKLAEGSKTLKEQRTAWKDTWHYDELAPTHDERAASHSGEYTYYEDTLNLIVKWVSAIQGEHGLDLGTGTGNLAGKFIAGGIHMSGVDQSKEMLRHSQRKYPTLEGRLGNFLAIPYLEGVFDFVVSSFAFHHLTNEQQLLALTEMRRVLKPRGRICIAGPMSSLLHLSHWFEENGYLLKQQLIHTVIPIIYAVPIR